jgi:hypothetical protein
MRGQKFVADSVDRIRRDGREGVRDTLYRLYKMGWKRVSWVYDPGHNVYDREWDVLVVLDACSAALMAEVAEEYDFLSEARTVRSNASRTSDWLRETFGSDRRRETAETAHVTGTPFSDSHLNPADFALLEEVWEYGWDDDLETIPAEPITDRAISHWRSGDYERMIVHYMQPHFPSVPRPELESGLQPDRFGQKWDSVWDRLRKGELAEATVRQAYRENLEYVLKNVEVLLTSIDAERVAITADHGNTFGRWGLYGHPPAPIAAIRNVPWCETSARDVSGYEPATATRRDDGHVGDAIEGDVESKLRDLGYL